MSGQNRNRKAQRPASSEQVPVDTDAPLFSTFDFLVLFRKMRIFIVLACIIVGVVVFVLAREDKRASPEFTSSVEVQILPGDFQLDFARKTLGGTREAQIASLVRSFSEQLLSDDVLARAIAGIPDPERVITQAGRKTGIGAYFDWLNYGDLPDFLPDPLDLVREATEISSIDGSFVMRVSVTLSDPERAADLANSIVDAYAQVEGEELERARESLLTAFTTELEKAETELRGLIDEEVRLRGALPADPDGVDETSGPTSEELVELRANLQSQEAMVRAIASLRGELVDRRIAASISASKTLVIRKAAPARRPDGPAPVFEGLAAAAGLFLFFIGSLVFATVVGAFSRMTAPKARS